MKIQVIMVVQISKSAVGAMKIWDRYLTFCRFEKYHLDSGEKSKKGGGGMTFVMYKWSFKTLRGKPRGPYGPYQPEQSGEKMITLSQGHGPIDHVNSGEEYSKGGGVTKEHWSKTEVLTPVMIVVKIAKRVECEIHIGNSQKPYINSGEKSKKGGGGSKFVM
jgi:hypothetical protein